MTLELRQSLILPDTAVHDLVFPERGLVTIVTGRAGRQAKTGLIGNEGLVGAVPILLAGETTRDEHFVQVAGHGLRIDAEILRQAVRQSESLSRLLLGFVQTLFLQTAQTAYVNLAHNLDARLSRCLLMCQDRIGGSDLAVTHEFLATMLGVQRSSVTVAVQVLEGNRLIRARRGRLEVLDRAGLEAVAGDAYGIPEAEYAHLVPAA